MATIRQTTDSTSDPDDSSLPGTILSIDDQATESYDLVKRVFDIVVSGMVILSILLWLIPILVLLIKASSKGPGIVVLPRIGYKGIPFNCFKFRTMYANGDTFKQPWSKDIRLSPFGRFLRKTNLDEMPQFINVFLGDMSIVGPRPYPSNLADLLKKLPNYKFRYLVKPGITGLAQIRGARAVDLNSLKYILKYDLFYFRNRSLFLDIKLMWLTIVASVNGNKNAW